MITVTPSVDWSPRVRHVILLGVAAVVLAVAADYAVKASREASAIVRWRGLVEHLVRGDNVYNEPGLGGSFPYPPFAGLVLWPFAVLPPVVAAMTWFAAKVVMAAIAIHWSIRLATADEFKLPARALVVLLVLVGRPIVSDLDHGNINVVILFLSVAALWSFRCRRDAAAGMLIALATAIKLTPALFIPYFAIKRQWRVVAASLIGLVLFVIFVPSARFGVTRNLELLRSWSDAMVRPYVVESKVETLQVNQSLPGVWLRLVTDSPGVKLEDDSIESINCVGLDRATATWLLKAMMIGVVGWVGWLSRGVRGRGDWRLACEFAAVFIAMLLISERSWKHHFVTMALPYAAILAHIARPSCEPALRAALRSCLFAAILLMASTSSELGGVVFGGAAHKYAQAYGLFGATAVVSLVALSVILRRTHHIEHKPATRLGLPQWFSGSCTNSVMVSGEVRGGEVYGCAKAVEPPTQRRWRCARGATGAAGAAGATPTAIHEPRSASRDARLGRGIFWVAVGLLVVLIGRGVANWHAGQSSRDRWGAPALVATCVWVLGGLASLRFFSHAIENKYPERAAKLRWRLARHRAQFALAAVSIALSLGVAELAARQWLPAPPLDWLHDYSNAGFDHNDWQESFCESDPELGWRGRPHASGECARPGLRFSVAHNSAGFRDAEHDRTSAGTRRRIAVVGDSFVWGFGVERDETVTARLSGLLDDVEVYNFGVCGYGTDQCLLSLRRLAADVKPDWVFYLLYVNDVADNQSVFQHAHFKPRFSLSGGQLKLELPPGNSPDAARLAARVGGAPPTPLAMLARPATSVRRVADYYVSPRSVLYRHVRRTLDAPARESNTFSLDPLTQSLIAEMRRTCDQFDARFSLVLIPDRRVVNAAESFDYFSVARAWAARTGIDCLDLSNAVARTSTAAYLDEGHWSAAGHDAAAAAIAYHLRASSDSVMARK